MQHKLLLVMLLVSPIWGFSQQQDKQTRMGVIKDAVGTIAGSKKRKTEIVLNDLREFRGKIIAVYPDHFILEPKEDDGLLNIVTIGNIPKPFGIRIKYADVLQLKGKSSVLSFVPDPAASPYSNWDEISSLVPGEFLQVHVSGRRKIHGVYFRSSPDSLSLLKGNKGVEIPASEVTKVYRIKGDTRSLATKIAEGGLRGSRVSEDWLPIGDPRGYAHPTALAIGAVMGSMLYILSIGKTERVLLFSR